MCVTCVRACGGMMAGECLHLPEAEVQQWRQTCTNSTRSYMSEDGKSWPSIQRARNPTMAGELCWPGDSCVESFQRRIHTGDLIGKGMLVDKVGGEGLKAWGRTEHTQGPAWRRRPRGQCSGQLQAAWCMGMDDVVQLPSFCCIYLFGITDHIFPDFHCLLFVCYGNINIQWRILPVVCNV